MKRGREAAAWLPNNERGAKSRDRKIARFGGLASNRVNSLCRYGFAHSHTTLPLVVLIGIEPGATRTRSDTLNPCEVDIMR